MEALLKTGGRVFLATLVFMAGLGMVPIDFDFFTPTAPQDHTAQRDMTAGSGDCAGFAVEASVRVPGDAFAYGGNGTLDIKGNCSGIPFDC